MIKYPKQYDGPEDQADIFSPCKTYLHKVHYLVLCSECGLVSVWASHKVADPQRNWHELQHLEGVIGKQTVVRVYVINE